MYRCMFIQVVSSRLTYDLPILVDVQDKEARTKALEQHAVYRNRTRLDDEVWTKNSVARTNSLSKGGFVFA